MYYFDWDRENAPINTLWEDGLKSVETGALDNAHKSTGVEDDLGYLSGGWVAKIKIAITYH